MSKSNHDNPYIHIKFQEGAVDKEGINGCQVENVLPVLIDKLKSHQNGPFACIENSIAINNLVNAQYALHCRKERIENKQRP